MRGGGHRLEANISQLCASLNGSVTKRAQLRALNTTLTIERDTALQSITASTAHLADLEAQVQAPPEPRYELADAHHKCDRYCMLLCTVAAQLHALQSVYEHIVNRSCSSQSTFHDGLGPLLDETQPPFS